MWRQATFSLSQALERLGVTCRIYDIDEGDLRQALDEIRQDPPDLLASYFGFQPMPEGAFFWDYLDIPFLALLLDPAIYAQVYLRSPLTILACVDQLDPPFLSRLGFERAFYFSAAASNDRTPPDKERPYDLVYIGHCFDPDVVRAQWPNRYSAELRQLMEEAAEIVLSDPSAYHVTVIAHLLAEKEIELNRVPFCLLCHDVDLYFRGKDRLEMLHAVGAPLHIFGGPAERGGGEWQKLLPQAIHHGPVSYTQALEIYRQSKICLNSSPFFKGAIHDRIFAALAAGSLPVSSDNPVVRAAFPDELVLTHRTSYDRLGETISILLSDDSQRHAMVSRGQTNIAANHTWDVRAQELLLRLL